MDKIAKETVALLTKHVSEIRKLIADAKATGFDEGWMILEDAQALATNLTHELEQLLDRAYDDNEDELP